MSKVPEAVAVLFTEACVQFRKARLSGADGSVFFEAANAIENAWPGVGGVSV